MINQNMRHCVRGIDTNRQSKFYQDTDSRVDKMRQNTEVTTLRRTRTDAKNGATLEQLRRDYHVEQ